MASMIKQFISKDDGADVIEYALVAGLISIAAIAALTTIGTKVSSLFTSINTKVQGVTIP